MMVMRGTDLFFPTGVNGRYRVHGGMYAREAKQEKYWKDPAGGRPAYFVPQRSLFHRPIAVFHNTTGAHNTAVGD